MSYTYTAADERPEVQDCPILRRLIEERVFSVEIIGDGNIAFGEMCDEFFGCDLTPDEVRELSAELLRIADAASLEGNTE